MEFSNFNEEIFMDIFKKFKQVNKCHWKIPGFNQVIQDINNNNFYEFKPSSIDKWSSKLRIELNNNKLIFLFIKNDSLPINIQQQLDKMVAEFYSLIKIYD